MSFDPVANEPDMHPTVGSPRWVNQREYNENQFLIGGDECDGCNADAVGCG